MSMGKTVLGNEKGYAVVEATSLFPIMMMIFAGLVLLAIYLPNRAVLQQATQYTATALATEQSDTWLSFDDGKMEYYWISDKNDLPNVYVALVASFFKGNAQDKAETVVKKIEQNSIVSRNGELEVECKVINYVVYKEIVVTATRTIQNPVDLSFVGFPKEIPVTVTSRAVVQNGDEFVRNIDLAKDFVEYLKAEYNLDFSGLSTFINKAWNFLGV